MGFTVPVSGSPTHSFPPPMVGSGYTGSPNRLARRRMNSQSVSRYWMTGKPTGFLFSSSGQSTVIPDSAAALRMICPQVMDTS